VHSLARHHFLTCRRTFPNEFGLRAEDHRQSCRDLVWFIKVDFLWRFP
jgi:hypothetical protein